MKRDHRTDTEGDWSLAELVILSRSLPAAELVQMVGVPPDRSWNRGDPQRSRGRVEPFNGITYRSRLARSDGLSAHLDDVLARLAPAKKRLTALSRRLAQQEGRDDAVRLWLTQLSGDTSLGFDFAPEQLDFLGDVGAWLGLSIDVYDPDHADPAPSPGAELAGIAGASERSPGPTG